MPARAQKRGDAGDERGEGREPGVHGAREGGEGGGVRALGYARVEVGSAGDGADGDLCGRARETISRGKARGRGGRTATTERTRKVWWWRRTTSYARRKHVWSSAAGSACAFWSAWQVKARPLRGGSGSVSVSVSVSGVRRRWREG